MGPGTLHPGCHRHDWLQQGSTKPIEDIKTEDEVKVTDPDTGKTTTRKVAGTIATEDDKTFVDLTATNAGKPSAGLIATTTHPFWVQSQHAWVKAGDLKPGMTLPGRATPSRSSTPATSHSASASTT
ncbi:hypothetical protein GCM10009575_087680 [Streptomyces rhizosphaericus]|uniref:Hint domain-containing protein n=1 Tax=Streptomyces rhizosphaericus TaxID=114699 RepID=A0ABN1RH89_9ACTN